MAAQKQVSLKQPHKKMRANNHRRSDRNASTGAGASSSRISSLIFYSTLFLSFAIVREIMISDESPKSDDSSYRSDLYVSMAMMLGVTILSLLVPSVLRNKKSYQDRPKQQSVPLSSLWSRESETVQVTDGVSSDLMPIDSFDHQQEIFSFTFVVKGIRNVIFNGSKYAVRHPGQVLTMALLTGVAGARAFYAEPTVAGLANSNAFVAWNDASDVYGSILSSNGTLLVNEFHIGHFSGLGGSSSAASLTNGGAFVTWNSELQSGYKGNFGRIYSATGTATTLAFQINQDDVKALSASSVAGLMNGNVFATWSGLYSIGDSSISGRIYSENGTSLTGEFQISGKGLGMPSVASLKDGNALVAWTHNDESDISGRIYSSLGVSLSDEFQITQNNNLAPHAIGLRNGNAMLIWSAFGCASPTKGCIQGRIYSPSGVALTNAFPVNQNVYASGFLSTAGLEDGNTLVTWGNSDTIVGRIFSPTGVALTNESRIDESGSRSFYPSAASLINGNALVAWQGQSPQVGLFGRTISPEDKPVTGVFEIYRP